METFASEEDLPNVQVWIGSRMVRGMTDDSARQYRHVTDDAFGLIADGVRPALERKWRSAWSSGYLSAVRLEIAKKQGREADQRYGGEESTDDVSFWLWGIRATWDSLLKHSYPSTVFVDSRALIDRRNKWAHREPIDLDWTIETLREASELLDAFEAHHQLAEIALLYISLRDGSPPPSVEVVGSGAGLAALPAVPQSSLVAELFTVLDEEQRRCVSRFAGVRPEGPWLVKGGPGSGKSLLTLHCIRTLLGGDQLSFAGVNDPPRVLLTTYTKALARTSRTLLEHMVPGEYLSRVDVKNIDKLPGSSTLRTVGTEEVRDIAEAELGRIPAADTLGRDFLLDELEWVIVGRGMHSLDEYLEADRSGRGRALDERQRRLAWAFYEEFRNSLRQKGMWLWSERQADAAMTATEKYDYVFVDEGQDLKPVGIALAKRLCKGGRNVYIALDPNQSIYGKGMPWKSIDDELDFRGRVVLLNGRYRTTAEIQLAAAELADPSSDRETAHGEAFKHGPKPVISWYEGDDTWKRQLTSFIRRSMDEEGLGPDSVAVLCRTSKQIEATVAALEFDSTLAVRGMRSDFDIAHPGVKVTTIHAAKGVGFPIVAVIGANDSLPRGVGEEDRGLRRRLLYVACTRAMVRLMVLADKRQRSDLLSQVTPDRWQIDHV
jgi:superfamily I DNA/RNA helicase